MLRFTVKAKKYWAVLIGVTALIGARYFEIEIPGLPDIVRDIIIGLAASEGVYQASNGQ